MLKADASLRMRRMVMLLKNSPTSICGELALFSIIIKIANIYRLLTIGRLVNKEMEYLDLSVSLPHLLAGTLPNYLTFFNSSFLFLTRVNKLVLPPHKIIILII